MKKENVIKSIPFREIAGDHCHWLLGPIKKLFHRVILVQIIRELNYATLL